MANWGGQVLVIGAVLSVFAILVLLTIFDKNKEKKAA
jgi:hypothetical protein